MTETYYSNGKLLLTGEYVVLDGALALAIPTKYGQSLTVKSSDKKGIQWKSYDYQGNVWFAYNFPRFSPIKATDESTVASQLMKILNIASRLNPQFLRDTEGITVSTKLDFPRNWGLGTSSTLINNIAQWAQVDAFELLNKSFGGSGYDIAAAKFNRPIVYKLFNEKPEIDLANLNWKFTDSLFFIHLNEKQNSKDGISRYKEKTKKQDLDFRIINEITNQILIAENLQSFEMALHQHEIEISKCIDIIPIKKRLFPDYPGMIKSLGAWGGDFILATGTLEQMYYFEAKGYSTIIPFKKMIK